MDTRLRYLNYHPTEVQKGRGDLNCRYGDIPEDLHTFVSRAMLGNGGFYIDRRNYSKPKLGDSWLH